MIEIYDRFRFKILLLCDIAGSADVVPAPRGEAAMEEMRRPAPCVLRLEALFFNSLSMRCIYRGFQGQYSTFSPFPQFGSTNCNACRAVCPSVSLFLSDYVAPLTLRACFQETGADPASSCPAGSTANIVCFPCSGTTYNDGTFLVCQPCTQCSDLGGGYFVEVSSFF